MSPPADQPALFDPAGEGRPPVRRTRRAFDSTVTALRRGGRLEAADALLVAVGRTNADRCDELRGLDGKEFHEAQALRLMFEIARELANVGGPASDAFDQLLAAATRTAPPGD
jgi:hypothetical protein